MDIRTRNEKEVTFDDVIAEATTIYKEFKAQKIHPDDVNGLDKYLLEVQSQHKEFSTTYTIVLRFMIQRNQYSHKAFKKYLLYLKHHPWKTEDDFIERQADYTMILYKELHPKCSTTEARLERDFNHRILKKEKQEFKENLEKFRQIAEQKDADYSFERRKQLITRLRELADAKNAKPLNTEVTDGKVTDGDIIDSIVSPLKDLLSSKGATVDVVDGDTNVDLTDEIPSLMN